MTGNNEQESRILQLLRHAKSSWQDPALDDRERPLNPRGHQAGGLLAAHFAALPPPDLVLCSSALRTRQTLDHISAAFATPLRVEIEAGLYLASTETLLDRIGAVADGIGRLLVIGHNPGLHDLARKLAVHAPRRDRARLADKFPTGALASFRLAGSWGEIAHVPIALIDYITPTDLGAPGERSD